MRVTVLALACALGVLGATRAATAYPMFQLSTGTDRCVACHYAPSGGGLINDYGRSEAGDTIAGGRGDGGFLHGAWQPPSWLALGGDYRGAGLVAFTDLPGTSNDQRELAGFPMQADLYARVGVGAFSLNLTAGLRGSARAPDGRDRPSPLARLGSREHYLQWDGGDGSLVARLGRFYPTFGLRLQDHTSYVRRYLGSYLLEEPYALSVTKFGPTWEAHVSAFVPSFVPRTAAGPKAMGVTAYAERRILDDAAALGAQLRVAVAPTTSTYTLGAVGKRWLPEAGVLLLGELDLQRQTFADDAGPSRWQLASYLGASKPVAARWWTSAGLHLWDPDVGLRASSRTAADVSVQYFPYAHVELHLLGRLATTGGNYDDPSALAMLQLHYFL